MDFVEGDCQHDNVRLFDRGGQVVGNALNRPLFLGFAGRLRRFIVTERGDLVFVVCQRQSHRSADLAESDDGEFYSHGFLHGIMLQAASLRGASPKGDAAALFRHAPGRDGGENNILD